MSKLIIIAISVLGKDRSWGNVICSVLRLEGLGHCDKILQLRLLSEMCSLIYVLCSDNHVQSKFLKTFTLSSRINWSACTHLYFLFELFGMTVTAQTGKIFSVGLKRRDERIVMEYHFKYLILNSGSVYV